MKAKTTKAKTKTADESADSKERLDPFFMKFRLTLVCEALGTIVDQDRRELYLEHILKDPDYAEDAEHLPKPETAEDAVDKQTTYFYVDDAGQYSLAAYQLKGFFKEVSSSLKKVEGSLCSNLLYKTNKQFIDNLVFPEPDFMPFHLPPGWTQEHLTICERPLRADTAKGPRVSISRSLSVPAGTYVEGQIKLLVPSHRNWVIEMLNHGKDKGLLQWRNSGKGRFIWEVIGDPKDGAPYPRFENKFNLAPEPPQLPEKEEPKA